MAISQKTLKKLLRKYNFRTIEDMKPLQSSGNISYLIKANKKNYLLRLSPPTGPRYRNKKEIAAELELLRHLKKGDVPVILPTEDKNGETIISYKKQHGYLRQMSQDEERKNPSISDVHKVGKMLGLIHSLTENFKTKNPRLHRFDPAETRKRLNLTAKKILKSNFKEKEEFIRLLKVALERLDFPPGLPQGMIHEDLGRRHILWRGKKISAVIDFDRSYFAPLVFDIGQTCRGWCFDGWKKWNRKKFKAIISGYEMYRKLKSPEMATLPNAIKFAILERALSFALRAIKTGDEEGADFARDCIFRQINLI